MIHDIGATEFAAKPNSGIIAHLLIREINYVYDAMNERMAMC